MKEPVEQADQTESLARGVASVISRHVTDDRRPQAWSSASFARLEHRVAARRRWQGLGALSVVAATAAVVCVGRAYVAAPPSRAITFTVDGRPPLSNRVVAATGATSASVLSFSDGTRIEMAARARGHVIELGQRGGRIALDEGTAHVEVAHRPGAAWLFQAGPFLITVHGTAFSMAWSSADSHFDLRMETGVVSVKGPLSGGEIVLRAGETLSVGLRDQGAPALAPAGEPLAPATSTARSPSALDSGPDRRREHTPASEAWPTALADGRSAAVVADARRLGIRSVLATRSSEDLAALADAARFQQDDRLARRALLAQRQRFGGSMRSAEASFLLGRLDDEASGGSQSALAWYERYLAEAPHGRYVSEALGREMMALEHMHRRQEAAAIASAYLREFPQGTYAAAAQALVSGP